MTNDEHIRTALHLKKLVAHRNAPNTIVVDELGLAHAKVRIDVAVINGCIHGYEIKSSVDKLSRLPGQLTHYTKCLGKLTLVCAPRHIEKVNEIAPAWCGILEADIGARGAIAFRSIRRARKNPDLDMVQLAHLLWRPEIISLLQDLNIPSKELRQSRKHLYKLAAELLTARELTSVIRKSMQARKTWRGLPTHASCGG
jgi:hypothetical protein